LDVSNKSSILVEMGLKITIIREYLQIRNSYKFRPRIGHEDPEGE